jgi:hypothetical protein
MAASTGSIYRDARRAFIAAAEAAHVDSIARLHPAKGRDGKPLFMDSVALGPRLAPRAVLAIANDVAGSSLATGLLKAQVMLPPDGRLVLIHAADPAAFPGIPDDPAWLIKMLGAVATEDLSQVRWLGLLPLDKAALSLAVPILAADVLSQAECRLTWVPDTPEDAKTIIRDLFGG